MPLVLAQRLAPIRHPLLRRFFGVWRTRYHAGACGRRDFDPAELVPLLPHIWLYDRCDGRWFCRLAGEEVRYQNGRELHRQWLESFIPAASLPDVQSYFDTVADLPGVGYVHGQVWPSFERPTQGERLVMPLWNEGATVGRAPANGLIGVTLASQGPPQTAERDCRVVVPLDQALRQAPA